MHKNTQKWQQQQQRIDWNKHTQQNLNAKNAPSPKWELSKYASKKMYRERIETSHCSAIKWLYMLFWLVRIFCRLNFRSIFFLAVNIDWSQHCTTMRRMNSGFFFLNVLYVHRGCRILFSKMFRSKSMMVVESEEWLWLFSHMEWIWWYAEYDGSQQFKFITFFKCTFTNSHLLWRGTSVYWLVGFLGVSHVSC